MSTAAHIQTALAYALFQSWRVKEAVDDLIRTLDTDLDRVGYAPSSAAAESVQKLVQAMKEAEQALAEAEEEEESEEERVS